MKSKYVSKEEYMEIFPNEDLDFLLDTHDGEGFIALTEMRLWARLEAMFCRNIEDEFHKMTDHQKKMYKMALIEQCHYVLHNGDPMNDSGISTEEGNKFTRGQQLQKAISPHAIDYLMIAGIYSYKDKGSVDILPFFKSR